MTTRLWLLALVVAGGLFTFPPTTLAPPAAADGPPEAQLIHIPLRWCALEGSPAVTNPAGVGEPDTDGVLWRRHERASDRIWIPGAAITLRSAFAAAVVDGANFPAIPDPRPPASGGAGQLGDILDPEEDRAELNEAIASCNAAWDALATRFGIPLVGPVGLNLRLFVNADGTRANLGGIANFGISFPGGTPIQDLCRNPGRITANSGNLFAAVIDNSFTLNGDPNETLLAHEFGHVLFLGHGNGLDDDGDGLYDQFCDNDENVNAPPPSLMTTGANSTVLTGPNNPSQRFTARAVARITSGAQLDPPAALVNGDTVNDQRVDTVREVSDESVDMATVGITVNVNPAIAVTRLTHQLFGIIPLQADHQYLVFLDLDGNPATGASPASLGFPTTFQGAELVTRVLVGVDSLGEFRTIRPTVWRLQAGALVDVTAAFPTIEAEVTTSTEAERGTPLFDVVSILLPNALVGAIAPQVRMQAISQDRRAGGQLDRLPDATLNEPTGGALPLYVVPPRFPVCGTTPRQVRPGGTTVVEATGLIPDRTAKVILGDELVASGPTDRSGNSSIPFTVPATSRAGARLVTVGIMGTALTADCTVEVVGQPAEAPSFEYAAKLICGVQRDPRDRRLAPGLYATEINVHNPHPREVRFRKKLALTYPPAEQRPGAVLPISEDGLGPDEALAVDCVDLERRLFPNGFPTPYITGFVVIESEASLDVTAVYTTAAVDGHGRPSGHPSIDVEPVRERQREGGAALADLVPVPDATGDYCRLQGNALVVTVRNQGPGPAGPSMTEVDFGRYGAVPLPTPALMPGAATDLFAAIPPRAFDPDLDFRITVDRGSAVTETNEGNNSATGSCIG